jgi:hypothetical protein
MYPTWDTYRVTVSWVFETERLAFDVLLKSCHTCWSVNLLSVHDFNLIQEKFRCYSINRFTFLACTCSEFIVLSRWPAVLCSLCSTHYSLKQTHTYQLLVTASPLDGFGGLVVSMLASGSRVQTRPKPLDFYGCKNPQHAFFRRGSKSICPMSQLCGM